MRVTRQHAQGLKLEQMREFVAASGGLTFAGAERKEIYGLVEGTWQAQQWLPAYAPELNPVEYVWAYWKQQELPHVCPKNYRDLSQTARRTLRRLRRRKRLIPSFWKQAKLSFESPYIMRRSIERPVVAVRLGAPAACCRGPATVKRLLYSKTAGTYPT